MMRDAESFLLKPKPEVDNKVGVLLFHGWTSSPYELKRLGEFLAGRGYMVSAPLLSGHGTKMEDLYSVGWKDWAEDAEKSYQELKKEVSEIFVAGISMGGNLAIRIAADHPEVMGIITMGAPLFLKKFYLRILLPILERIHPVTNKSYKYYRRMEILKYKRHYWSFPTKSIQDAIDGMIDSRKMIKNVKCPALIMQSTYDQILVPRNARVLFKNFGTSEDKKEFVWIKDSDHSFIVDIYQEQIFEKVLQFINQNLTPNPSPN